jgi:exodeoxyribonuclease VII small subunit
MSPPTKPKTFKEALDGLEKIVAQIESGQVELEESVKRYEEGMALIKQCRAILNQAEQKIQQLHAEEEREEG